MSDVFDKQKAASLSGVDLSRKGSVDDPIQPLVTYINKQRNYFTTSSCSGRILVADNADDGTVRKKGCKWIMTAHSCVSTELVCQSLKDIEENAVFKFEPFVLHVQCRSLQDAQMMLQCGVASGFRNSGISVGNKGRYITAIRSTHSLEVPLSCRGKVLVSEEYVNFLVDTSNKKMEENFRRIERFFDNLKSAVNEAKDDSADDKTRPGKCSLKGHRLKTEGRTNQHENSSSVDNRQDMDKYNDRDSAVDEIDISDCIGFLDEG